jgi:hypothetical protein
MFLGADLGGRARILNGIVDMGAHEGMQVIQSKVFLQGPYDSALDAMTAWFAHSNAIPSTAPYASDPAAVERISSNIVDWVALELRDTAYQLVDSQSALLKCDGTVVSIDGSPEIVAEVSPGDELYLVIKQRNHLTAMSAQPLVFTNVVTTYDFTTNWSQYAGGSNACVELEPGVWGMIAGDADGDGEITEVDRAIVTNQVGRTGYLCGDLTLDGIVTGED